MSEHEPCVGATDEWYTPPHFFEAFNTTFDLDPCSPGPGIGFVPARHIITAEQDGLAHAWFGLVWMNPPFGGRNGQVPWLRKFRAHGNGIALVAARTSAGWFHDHAIGMQTVLFPRGKTKFHRPDGTIGKAPGTGIVLLGMGFRADRILQNCGLGWIAKSDYHGS
jgi:hypothetical protein